MPASFVFNFIILIFLCSIKESEEIRNAKIILPSIVQASTSATLLCLFDLEGAPLYSVQWYRGQFEFYRFVPNESPPIKTFQVPGLHVDTFASNEHQVTLRNTSVQISGEFSCEITTDALPFSAACVSDYLTVVDLTLKLRVNRKQYRFGDNINANCSLKPKLPFTKLIFHWNTKSIPDNFIQHNPEYSSLHFNTSVVNTNRSFPMIVHLRCSALLNNTFYIISKSASLQLEPSIPWEKSSSFNLQNERILCIFIIFMAIQNYLVNKI